MSDVYFVKYDGSLSDVYFIKYRGSVYMVPFMSTVQAYLGQGSATRASYSDKPAVAFSSKSECMFFIKSHRYYGTFEMEPYLIRKPWEFKFNMFDPDEVDK